MHCLFVVCSLVFASGSLCEAGVVVQMEDEACQLHLHIPVLEKDLRQMLSSLSKSLTSAADASVMIFQQACYMIASNPFSLVADIQLVVSSLSEACLGPAFLSQHLLLCLGSIKDGLLPASNVLENPAASKQELQALHEALENMHQLVNQHAQAQAKDTASLVTVFTEGPVLNNFLNTIVDRLSTTLVKSRGGLRQHMDFLTSLTQVTCVHLMKSLLCQVRADFTR